MRTAEEIYAEKSRKAALEYYYSHRIKALECCGHGVFCNECPMFDRNDCEVLLYSDALDLIKRQQAEIERLQEENKNHKSVIEAIEDTINHYLLKLILTKL